MYHISFHNIQFEYSINDYKATMNCIFSVCVKYYYERQLLLKWVFILIIHRFLKTLTMYRSASFISRIHL